MKLVKKKLGSLVIILSLCVFLLPMSTYTSNESVQQPDPKAALTTLTHGSGGW
ncbi:hypothetical protein ACTHQ2_23035 [Bacillus subtilis]|uniref:hypothetical protein n=1 Tax=Bacillus subtilis TaxID=1423 RepID=UPI003F7B65B6